MHVACTYTFSFVSVFECSLPSFACNETSSPIERISRNETNVELTSDDFVKEDIVVIINVEKENVMNVSG